MTIDQATIVLSTGALVISGVSLALSCAAERRRRATEQQDSDPDVDVLEWFNSDGSSPRIPPRIPAVSVWHTEDEHGQRIGWGP